MDMAKPLQRYRYGLNRGPRLFTYFSSLAGYTIPDQEATSARMPGQMQRAVTILRVARIPGWAMPWIELKTCNLFGLGH
jgi:hypothetical protein